MNWSGLLVMLVIALIFSACGFYKYVYFMSVGYGASVAALGVGMMIIYRDDLNAGAVIMALLMVIYGCRLSGFLIMREIQSKGYRKVMDETMGGGKDMAIYFKLLLWISVAILYVMQTSPMFYRLSNGNYGGLFSLTLGIIISAIGIILESMADYQKNEQKKVRADMVAMNGLYKIVRCPNYLGEILFWTGLFVSGFGVLEGLGQWIIAILGYLLIFYVMVDSARRLEKKQNKRYGDKEEYRRYTDSTPILFPFVPLYHFNKNDSNN